MDAGCSPLSRRAQARAVGTTFATPSEESSAADSPSHIFPNRQAVGSSISGVSTPTHLTYNPESYKPDQDLESKV